MMSVWDLLKKKKKKNTAWVDRLSARWMKSDYPSV